MERCQKVGFEQLALIVGHGVGVLRLRKTARPDVGDVGLERFERIAAEFGVLLDELGNVARGESEHVVPDEHLAVALHARTDADGRNRQRPE